MLLDSIGSLFNAAPNQSKQDDVEGWAKECYPLLWTHLETVGVNVSDIGMRYFKIDRTIEP